MTTIQVVAWWTLAMILPALAASFTVASLWCEHDECRDARADAKAETDPLVQVWATPLPHARERLDESAGLDLPSRSDTAALAGALPSRVLQMRRTGSTPTAPARAVIGEQMEAEWPAMIAARDRALRTPTQEFRAIVLASLSDIAEWRCLHCQAGQHADCPGCPCPCLTTALAAGTEHAHALAARSPEVAGRG